MIWWAMNGKIVGILGGMGPEASAYLFKNIIKSTKVEKEQDHLRVIIDCNPKIPDRTAAILGEGPEPTGMIIKTGKNLELLGVTVAGIPCITAHYYYEEIQKALSYPLINMLEELKKRIEENYPANTTLGILATTGSIKTRIFERYLSTYKIVYPQASTQDRKVMEAIYGIDGIKKGNLGEMPLRLLREAGMELIDMDADLLIAGCTEIPLVLKAKHIPVPFLDPVKVLAQALVNHI